MNKKFLILCAFFAVSPLLVGKSHDVKSRANKKEDTQKKDQKISVEILNQLLADDMVLLMQTLNYHWNLVGPEFHDYHLLLDKQYHMLFEDLDLIAERVRAVGGQALGSMEQVLKQARLKEDRGVLPEPKRMIENLLEQYKIFITHIRNSIKSLEKNTDDYGSKKMLEDLLEKYEKVAWMLRSLLGNKQ